MRTVTNPFWSNWKLSLAAVVIIAAVAGLISAWLTPRGPVTTSAALLSMLAALGIGLIAGLMMGTRWAALLAPAVFIAVFELARLNFDGPSVDGIHLGSTYGVIAFLTGRLAHAILVLAPMILGVMVGVWLAARLGKSAAPMMGIAGWLITTLLTIALAVVALSIARPASTAAILDQDGERLAGSVAELINIPVNGNNQALMLRGRSSENPVLLYLAGGPGGTDLGAMRLDVALEERFVVATWDQRGAGKSYAALDPSETLTLDQVIADTVEVVNYLRQRFEEDKIYLVGNSWGTVLGVLTVQQHPELFHAYVGAGQMVSLRDTDVMFYQDTLAWAEKTGNSPLLATLRKNGPPPYQDLLKYEAALSHEHDWNPYPELDFNKEMPAILFVTEYTWMDRINAFRGFLDTFAVLYPQLQTIDFRRDVQRLDVPVYVVLGRHEVRGRAVLAEEWFNGLDAPSKELVIFEHSGHRTLFEEPAAFSALMTRVLNDTYTR